MVAKPASSSKLATTPAAHVSGQKRFKGVRMRSWGKWVSEIRLPNTRARLWLGSYATAEQAARAFDVAFVCLRGRSATLNFPHSPPSYAPLGLPHHQIQELAAAAAAAASPSSATSSSPAPTPFHSRANSASQLDSPTSAASNESEAATTDDVLSWHQSLCLSATSAVSEATTTAQCSSLSSASAGSSESEAATTNEMNSSSGCSSPLSTAHTLEDLLLLEEDDEQSSSWMSSRPAALQEEQAVQNMGREWKEDALLLLDEDGASSLMNSPFAALQEEQALHNMGREWEEELLWGFSVSPYLPWDQHLLQFPPLLTDDDLTAIVEPCLWSL